MPPGGGEAALREMEACALPILCGGTGMYFSALVKGIAAVPEVPEAARAKARRLLAEQGSQALHARLDPETAARLKPGDSQRVSRAYEVLLGTGRGLTSWQAETTQPLTGWRTRMILLDPPRETLRAAIAKRFATMLEAGAVDEVRALLAQNLPPDLPLLRAHGVPEIAALLRGEISREDAAARAILATHQYTKRQMTWFRHQKLTDSAGMQIIHSRIDDSTQFSERELSVFDNLIKHDS